MFLGELVSLNQWSPPLPLRALTQWEGRTFSSVKVNVSAPCIRERKRYPSPSLFLARSPRCVLAILFHPPFLSSARSTCDLATGQVLSVGEFIRRMPVTPLSRIHFQINRPSSCGPSNVNHPVCAKLHPPSPKYSNLDYHEMDAPLSNF